MNSNRISHALESLNSFHSNIKFTVEIEKGNKIAFLDILLIRYKDPINTTVYQKKMNTDLYINWMKFIHHLFLQAIGNGEHLKP